MAAPARARRPVALLGVIVVTAVVTATLTWLVSSRWVEQRRAGGRPTIERQDPLTARVERRGLTASAQFDGKVQSDRTVGVAVPAPVSGVDAVVTDLPVGPGQTVSEGTRIASVSDRPLLVLGGGVQPYRDLRPGDVGTDVAQLQAALVRLRLLAPPAGDVYDGPTKEAVALLYESAGTEPIMYQPEGDLDTLHEDVLDAEEAVKAARAGTDVEAITAAIENRTEARQAEVDFEAASGPLVSRSEVVVVDGLPMVVAKVDVNRGETASPGKSLLVLASTAVTVGARVPGPVAAQLKAGMATRVTEGAGGSDGLVADVGTEPDDNGEVIAVVALADASAVGPAGSTVGVIVTIGSVPDALVVPISALGGGTGGGATVTVLKGRSLRRVSVKVLLVAEGEAAVRPVGSLGADDMVVLG